MSKRTRRQRQRQQSHPVETAMRVINVMAELRACQDIGQGLDRVEEATYHAALRRVRDEVKRRDE